MADQTTSATSPDTSTPAVSTLDDKPDQAPDTNGDASAMEAEDDMTTEHAKIEESTANGEKSDAVDAAQEGSPADGTPGSIGKDKKRKSTGGVPEHKSKKNNNRKKPPPPMHLDCKPGEFYWARLKGYPPWPAIICDESMLPESLLGTRPVSTARPDGSIRDDFKEGGKNAKERTFPIMFLATNEFQWMINTALTPLEPKDCETLPPTKMTKALKDAYLIASEGHDIEYFKKILRKWQEEEEIIRQAEEEAAVEAERQAALEAEAAEKGAQEEPPKEEKAKKKKAPRKSKGGDDDIEMADADAPKSSKKRKSEAISDTDAPKPKKTPKVMKLNAPKTPASEASAKKSATKSKKKVVSAPKVEADETKPQLTEEQKLEQREKAVLYLRHRLQKGFLSRDQAPKEEEMSTMADFFSQLEAYENLEPSIIRTTKIHKVLKAIIKLATVPKDEEYNFKKRSTTMLEIWNKRMEAEGDGAPQSAVEKPEANGHKAAAKEPSSEAQATAAGATSDAPTEPKDTEMKDADAAESSRSADADVDVEKAEPVADKIEQKVESEKMNATSEPPQPDVTADASKNEPSESADLGNGATDEKDEN